MGSNLRDRASVGRRLFSLYAMLLLGLVAGLPGQSVAASTAGTELTPAQLPEKFRIHSIEIDRQTIFSQEQAHQLLYRAANAVHSKTRAQTILREIGTRPGDDIGAEEIAEIERNLRRLGIFAQVSVNGLERAAGGYQLQIKTRDQLSIITSASGSYLGGVGTVGLTLGERNLLGLGDAVTLSFSRDTNGQTVGAVGYDDLHFLRPDWRARYRAGRTEEGAFAGFVVGKPFKFLNQQHSWQLSLNNESKDIDFYASGRSVVQQPIDASSLQLSHSWQTGDRHHKRRRGLRLRFSNSDYQMARGSQAEGFRTPGDNRLAYAGIVLGRSVISGYRKLQNADTLAFVQDRTLGRWYDWQLGVAHRDGDGSGIEPGLSVTSGASKEFSTARYLSVRAAASASIVSEQRDPWSLLAAATLYDLSRTRHTLAMRLDYQLSDGGDRLPHQLSLGESSGLRGYPVRQFNGRRRVRLNLEDRYHAGWQLGPLDVGLVGFFDAGWIAGASESLRSVGSSVGMGLRIGSNALLGGGVFRIDLAQPLTHINGQRETPVLSLTLGQVFTLTP